MTKVKNITAVILAGGKSQRMGMDKGLLLFNGLTLVEILYRKLNSLFENIIVNTNNPNSYSFLDVKIIKDQFPYSGPLAGIHAALKNSESELNLIIPVDLPFLTKNFISEFIEIKNEEDILVPEFSTEDSPIFGLYNKRLLNNLESVLVSQTKNELKLSFNRWLKLQNVKSADIKKLNSFSEDLFFNMNNLSDYKLAETKLK